MPVFPITITRRTLLGAAVAVGTVAAAGELALAPSADAMAATVESSEFLALSQFLTGGHPLDGALADRYAAALLRHDAGFAAALDALKAYVATAKAASIDDLLVRPDLSDPVRKTITQIVSSWYLGIVGKDVDAELISYEEALMYRPTQDVLVIPTYGAGPDTWGPKPEAA